VIPKKWRGWANGLRRETYALYLACRDPRCPWYARILAICVVAYAASPIDLIPDPIPVLGQLDDLILVPLGVVLVRRLIPADVMNECRQRATEALSTPTRGRWIATAVILTIWAMILIWIMTWLSPYLAG